MYREPARAARLNPVNVSTKKLEKAIGSLQDAARKDPKAVQAYLKEFKGSLARGAVVATGRPAPAKKETPKMSKPKAAKAARKTPRAKKSQTPAAKKARAKRAATKRAAPAAAATAPKTRKRRTPRAVVAGAARALAPKKMRRVKRANLKKGAYMDRKGSWRRVNPTTDTKLLIAKVASFGVGLVLAEGLDRYLATRATETNGVKTKELYGRAAAAAIRSRADGVRMFAQAAGAGVFGVAAYLLRKKSAYAMSVCGGLAAAFGVKLVMQIAVDHVLPALLKTKTATEETLGNRLYPDKMAVLDEAAPGTQNGPRRFFAGNPARRNGSVGTARVPLSLGEVFSGSVGCGGGCQTCGQGEPCGCAGSRAPIGGLDYGDGRPSVVPDPDGRMPGGIPGGREGGGTTIPSITGDYNSILVPSTATPSGVEVLPRVPGNTVRTPSTPTTTLPNYVAVSRARAASRTGGANAIKQPHYVVPKIK